MALTDKLGAIGDAIRSKTGKTDLLTLDQMATEIGSISNLFADMVYRNKITTITAEDLQGITKIGSYAFAGCPLRSIEIPSSVTSIGDHAFYRTNISSITIPASVTYINNGSMLGFCDNLTSITVEEGNPKFHSDGNCLINTEDKVLISGCQTSVIPADGSVTTIESAFMWCNKLKSIFIPATITKIEYGAFWECSNMEYYDFSTHTTVPTLQSLRAFWGIPKTCEIRVPAALYDTWILRYCWSDLADHIVAV
jgi:hypothetical protein